MQTLEQQINNRIDEMVTDVMGLVQEAAVAAVTGVFKSVPRRGAPQRRGEPSKKRSRDAMTGHRSSQELADLTERLHGVMCERPGECMETLAKQVGESSANLALPARHLLRDGRARKAGQRNQTRYFPL